MRAQAACAQHALRPRAHGPHVLERGVLAPTMFGEGVGEE